jgi:adenosylhomocysteine nucleosidase
METIGLIAALGQEIKPFLQRAGKSEPCMLGPFPCFRFELFSRSCLLVKSGMGFRRATHAARRLLEEVEPEFLVSFGVAGAVNDDLHVGDVVAGESVYLFEKETLRELHSLAQLSAGSQQAGSQALKQVGAKLVLGAMISTQGLQPASQQLPEIPHPVLEMETAGVAQVAAESRIPLLALRAVSDTIAQPLPFNIEEFFDDDINPRIIRIITTVIRQPHRVGQFLRLGRNVDEASNNLAIALIAVLSQPSPILLPSASMCSISPRKINNP